MRRLNPDLPRLTPGVWITLACTAGYLLAAAVGAVVTGNVEFVGYLVMIIIAMLLAGVIHWFVGLTTPLLAMLSVMGALHMAGGLMPVPEGWPVEDQHVLYDLWLIKPWLRFDHLVHAIGYGIVTWFWWQFISAIDVEVSPTPGRMLVCGFASVGVGGVNEMVEFIATRILPDTNVGGFVNTGWDLVANFTDAMLAAVTIWFADWRRPEKR